MITPLFPCPKKNTPSFDFAMDEDSLKSKASSLSKSPIVLKVSPLNKATPLFVLTHIELSFSISISLTSLLGSPSITV